jgi:hypothetical protein
LSHIERALDPPVSNPSAGHPQRLYFGMRRGIGTRLPAVMTTTDDLSGEHDDRAHWNITGRPCSPSLLERS